MKDITTPDDVHLLVRAFYGAVQKDHILGPIFNDIAKVNWQDHLSVMVTFWESLLLKTDRYRRNALKPHLKVFQKVKFEPGQMERWLTLFEQTVNTHFYGEIANKAKHWARGIAHNLQKQIISKASM